MAAALALVGLHAAALRAEIIVREARLDDCPAIDDLLVDVYVGEGYTAVERSADLRNARERVQNADLLVVIDAETGTLLGSVTLITNGGPIARISKQSEAEVRLLGVARTARRQSVGAALVLDCIDRARSAGCRGIVLYTQPTMAVAHRLYKRVGFVRGPDRDFTSEGGVRMRVYKMTLR